MITDNTVISKYSSVNKTKEKNVPPGKKNMATALDRCKLLLFSQSLDSYVESLNIQVERFLNVFRCFIDTVELPSSEELKTRKYIKRCEENNLINAFMGNFGAIKKQYEVTK